MLRIAATGCDSSRGRSLGVPRKSPLNLVDYQPVALFHRLVTGDQEAFAQALNEALDHHERYWSDSTGPHSRVALGPLALAYLAFDSEFPVNSKSPYLPTCLLDRAWYGEFDT
ncbi:Imm49 family immunity protein [Streptomyces sp. NPDC056938]|uniref:Imm49 family immunity protein n=1 Tax=unclassified Streptomyces TaxID=2593676 RepID=UPI00362AC2A9